MPVRMQLAAPASPSSSGRINLRVGRARAPHNRSSPSTPRPPRSPATAADTDGRHWLRARTTRRLLEGYHEHGVFAYALLASFSEAKTDKNELVNFSDLADDVAKAVPELSEATFKVRQVPQMSIEATDFPLATHMNVLGDPQLDVAR